MKLTIGGCVGGDPVGAIHAKGPTHGGGAQAAVGSSGGVDYAEQQGAQAAVLGVSLSLT